MTPERHARIKELFLSAGALPPEQRADFLRQECASDQELRDQVEKLLEHDSAPAAGGSDSAVRATARMEDGGRTDGSAEVGRHGFSPGTIIAGRYRLVALLGRGGMGDVYRADDLTLRHPVALKFLPAPMADDPARAAQLRAEVRVARGITNPHVCRVHDIAEVNGEWFMTMEYVDGEDLHSLLKRIGRAPREKALDIARQLCAGVAAAHAKGVLHRDLKPANIMLDGRGKVIITDFGLAGLQHEIHRSQIRSGTPAYMAPEQLAGREVTFRSDIYALGLVLYELFTGQPAFRAPAGEKLATLDERIPPVRPSHYVGNIDPAVERIILQCLEPRPQDRPPSAAAVFAALPGGDVLAAALAAGEIPSPEMVAAAGPASGIRAPLAFAGLIGFLILLLVAVLLSSRLHPIAQARFSKPPPALAEKAREILRELAVAPTAGDEAYGLSEQRQWAWGPSGSGGSDPLRFAAPAHAILFWYRQSPSPLVPSNPVSLVFGHPSVTPTDPPPGQPGVASLLLDAKGRLLGLEAAPGASESSLQPTESDDWPWPLLILRAGLDERKLRPSAPRLAPPPYADRRVAWTGVHPDDDKLTLRVEGTACNNKPITFAVLAEPATAEETTGFLDYLRRKTLVDNTRTILLTILIVVSIPLARRNVREGRSDLRGAFRLATFVLILRLIAWLLQASHTLGGRHDLDFLKLAIAGTLTEAALVALFYLALEPLVRRFWPQTLIAWSRALAGRWRDPFVGLNVLLGAVVGVFWVVLVRSDEWITAQWGLVPREAIRPDEFFVALTSARHAFAFCLDTLRSTIYESLFLLLLLVLLRAALRRPLLAGVLGFLLIAPLFVPRGTHPVVSLVVIGLGAVASALYVLTRFGLVPIVTAFFVAIVLLRFPLTLDLRMWYADASVFAVVVAATVAAYGFLTARMRTPSAAPRHFP